MRDIDYILSFLGGIVVGGFSTFVIILSMAIHCEFDTEQINSDDDSKTVAGILKMREVKQKTQFSDSVFLNMPESALMSILMKVGTEISVDSITKEYLKNKSYHDGVSSAQIEK